MIRIGSVGTLSGPAGNNLKPQTDGVRVWVRWINDRGGLNGHPVELVVGDDGGDPARHRSLVQEFVEQRNVIALVGNPEALTGASSVEYLTEAGVPVIGSEAAGQWFYESPVYFPQSSHGSALSQGTQAVGSVELKKRGLTKVGVIACVEVQICRDAYDKAPRQYAKVGMQVVYRAQASFGQPDYTAECLNAEGAGAQIIAMAMDGNSVTRIAGSCARQGFRPVYTYTNGIALPQHRADPNLQGSVVATPVAPWIYGGTPATKEFQDAMARYAPGTEVQGGHMPGWVAAKVFERGGARLGEPATRPALLDGLWAIHGDVMPELTGPLLYNRGRPATPVACAFAVTIKDSRWVAINDARRECTDFDPNI